MGNVEMHRTAQQRDDWRRLVNGSTAARFTFSDYGVEITSIFCVIFLMTIATSNFLLFNKA